MLPSLLVFDPDGQTYFVSNKELKDVRPILVPHVGWVRTIKLIRSQWFQQTLKEQCDIFKICLFGCLAGR